MKQAKVLNEQELKRLFAIIASQRHAERNRLAVMLSFQAGLRVREIAHLKHKDVRTGDGDLLDRVHLNPSYTKGGHSRTIFLNGTLIKEIERYLRHLSGLPAPLSTRLLQLEAPLIPSQKRQHFSPNTLCQLFSTLYSISGIKGASSHSGRRYFITKLAHSGVSPKIIMELVGHKQLSTTQRYIEVTETQLRKAVNLI
ncbi:MAG: site-specific integrase [Alphaproteobacteria bacterium]|nr:MAG: site-specific integrase [Alphaproteobacteria bacterium]